MALGGGYGESYAGRAKDCDRRRIIIQRSAVGVGELNRTPARKALDQSHALFNLAPLVSRAQQRKNGMPVCVRSYSYPCSRQAPNFFNGQEEPKWVGRRDPVLLFEIPYPLEDGIQGNLLQSRNERLPR